MVAIAPLQVWQDLDTGVVIDAVHAISRAAAASDPMLTIRCPACERLVRRIPDVPINLLELDSGTDVSGKVGAVQCDGHETGRVEFVQMLPRLRSTL